MWKVADGKAYRRTTWPVSLAGLLPQLTSPLWSLKASRELHPSLCSLSSADSSQVSHSPY
jgi:hypothetical protein